MGKVIKLSDEQRRVLKRIARAPATPKECRTGVRTFLALARRKLIYVATSFDSIIYPRIAARAEITGDGLAALKKVSPHGG